MGGGGGGSGLGRFHPTCIHVLVPVCHLYIPMHYIKMQAGKIFLFLKRKVIYLNSSVKELIRPMVARYLKEIIMICSVSIDTLRITSKIYSNGYLGYIMKGRAPCHGHSGHSWVVHPKAGLYLRLQTGLFSSILISHYQQRSLHSHAPPPPRHRLQV